MLKKLQKIVSEDGLPYHPSMRMNSLYDKKLSQETIITC